MSSRNSALVEIAVDLTRSLGKKDRYERLLSAVMSAIPCDATAILALRGQELVPLATHGLSPQVLGMRFALSEHPRLARIVAADGPVRFPADAGLPDPFDGLVDGAPDALAHVHDCLGCPLVADGDVVGALTADALRVGSFDNLDDELVAALGALAGAALRTTRLFETIEALAEKRGQVLHELTRESFESGAELLGVTPVMDRLRGEIETVGASELSVLVLGETGVGKELAARAIHASSPRRDGPFIQVNCAALPESVVESELFGHLRGAFTGAVANRFGKFELADGGTLFLDEIGELPILVQPKLLRAIQEGEIQRVGADAVSQVDVRIIAATNRDLENEVERGRFRADLYHRLNVYPVHVPPLRERRKDIPVLAGYFLDRHRARVGMRRLVLGAEAAHALCEREWPGNVRELDHVLARAALRVAARSERGGEGIVGVGDLDVPRDEGGRTAPAAEPRLPERRDVTMRVAVDDFKKRLVERALKDARGNWAEAARSLGMHRSNLHHMAKRLGIEHER